MKHVKLFLASALMLVGVGVLAVGPSVAALDPGEAVKNGVEAAGSDGTEDVSVNFADIVNILLYVIGAVSVIMIVIGGLRYVLSGGDSSAVTGAKNTILYAVVGLIVAILAYAIVNFVLKWFA